MTKSMTRKWQGIRRKMEAAAEILRKQGAMTSRLASGRRVFSIRFRRNDRNGKRTHAAIYVGSDVNLIDRAQRLLDEFRRRERWRREAKLMVKFAAALCRVVKKHKNRTI